MPDTPLPSPFQCAPKLRRKGTQSCVTRPQMERLRAAYTTSHAVGGKQGGSRRGRTQRRKKGAALPQLRTLLRAHYACDTEYCMVRKAPGLRTEERDAMLRRFRPAKPEAWTAKPTEWLDSYNIEDVMAQYEEAYPDFDFIGPVPIDFDATTSAAWGRCVVDELCRLDLKEAAARGTKRLGIIFNMDAHDKPGSHWVCAFVDLPSASAYYYDSYGLPPPPEVERLLGRLKEQGVRTVLYNDLRAQYRDTECGMYCLMVVICLLRGRTFEQVCAMRVTDGLVNAFRDVLFVTERPRGRALTDALPTLCT